MQRPMKFTNQAAGAQLVLFIDAHHRLPLTDLIYDDLQEIR
jgi:hypothetical protein